MKNYPRAISVAVLCLTVVPACGEDDLLLSPPPDERRSIDPSAGAPIRSTSGEDLAPVWGDGPIEVLANQCGGPQPLRFNGTLALPGDACGDVCGSGILYCFNRNQLRCTAEILNACGGCDPLTATPGDSCGGCAGAWQCSGQNSLVCNDPGQNDCGGCAALANPPGEPCTRSDGSVGIFACQTPDTTTCQANAACGDGSGPVIGTRCGAGGTGSWTCVDNVPACTGATPTNACGGFAGLVYAGVPSSPGDTCGAFGDGVLTCAGSDVLVCSGATVANACGGAFALTEQVGDPCGACGTGTFACSVAGGLTCAEQDINACGGCSANLGGSPGDACDDGGAYYCRSRDALACGSSNLNACGSVGELTFAGSPAVPGEPCGASAQGILVCNIFGALACFGQPALNACGGTSILPSTPGAPCGACGQGTYVCDGHTLVCEGSADGLQSCGGCEALPTEPGLDCVAADGNVGVTLCDGPNDVLCSADLSCLGHVNACGGCELVVGGPGSPCGACDTGAQVCDGTDELTCRDTLVLNACGGCATLDAQVGAPCGRCGTGVWTCDGDGEGLVCFEAEGCDLGLVCDNDSDCLLGNCARGRCAPSGMLQVFAGSYLRGDAPDRFIADGRTRPQHQVTLTHSYFLDQTETTQAAWLAAMGTNPAAASACGLDCPVESVSFLDAVSYANRRSQEAGLPQCYVLDGSGSVQVRSSTGRVQDCLGYRLPTEAEWEHAARAGSLTDLPSGNIALPTGNDPITDAFAWFRSNAGGTAKPVVTRTPNGWGFFDLAGNVQEWTDDRYTTYPVGSVTDPSGASFGNERVIRGGSFNAYPQNVRSAFRTSRRQDSPSPLVGLRLARTVPPGDCLDGRTDGNETDVDCGGGCSGCDAGSGCALPLDCSSNICLNQVCLP